MFSAIHTIRQELAAAKDEANHAVAAARAESKAAIESMTVETRGELEQTAALLKAPASEARDKVQKLVDSHKALQKEIERLRKTYPEIITTYGRGEKETATKFRLWEIQDAIQQEAKDQKKVIAGSKLNRRS